ncbi:ABC transporter [Candidatus Bathyarchaeota archaeon]|mgnify:CR=1 FL=1|nr:MAG: ABC transporter [Candidatus Bathyarchaeota archaeon]
MISIKNLCKEWTDFSLKNIDLHVKTGEYLVILGPTGAGKTLLLETIAGFHRPDSGEIWIDGEDVTGLPPEKREIGFVYQDYMLFPHMTVEENVEFGLKVRGLPRIKRKKMVDETLELIGLTHLRKRRPRTLSGGEQQKTALARALVVKPKILLLDEPLSALDVNTQKTLREELRKIHKVFGITTIHVTHNHFEAYILAERLAVMKDGTIVQIGSPEEVFRKPKNDFVARFMGFENLFDGEIVDNRRGVALIDINGITIEAVTSKTGRCIVGIRPDDIIVSKYPLKSSMRNTLKGIIVDYMDMGSLVNLTVEVNGIPYVATITKRSFDEMKLNRSTQVYIAFKASAVHVM